MECWDCAVCGLSNNKYRNKCQACFNPNPTPVFFNKISYIVHGYVRNANSKETPKEITGIILLFYDFTNDQSLMKFDQTKYGDKLQFINDKQVQHIGDTDGSSIAIFSSSISSQFCNEFKLYFKIHSYDFNGTIGWVQSKNDIKDWNQCLGYANNKDTSIGIWIARGWQEFRLYHKDNQIHLLSHKLKDTFHDGDIVAISFNFCTDKVQLYHNEEKADSLSLDGAQSIIPCVSLCWKQQSFEIIKHECR